MKTLLTALIAGALACAAAPMSAQEKKVEPAKEATKGEVKKTDKAPKEPAEKAEKAEVTKDVGKKKVKKGGC